MEEQRNVTDLGFDSAYSVGANRILLRKAVGYAAEAKAGQESEEGG